MNDIEALHALRHEQNNRRWVREAIDNLEIGKHDEAVYTAKIVVETHNLFGLMTYDNPDVIIPLVEAATAVCCGDLDTARVRYAEAVTTMWRKDAE